ncbi:MAG: hypothetical protein LBL95_08145 [Deltaproteobacteria bacterium]|jgi:uncharacterized protein YjlB|nr:hypothetical protein [Deltaproteobacteria bacterium]
MKKGAVITNVAPLPLAPIVADKPWGSVCRSSFNVPSRSEGVRWGEIWLASEDFGLVSKVASGPRAGQSLAAVKAEWGSLLAGEADPGKSRQTLPLSFRLERTGETPGPVRAIGGDEFWYVLEAGPDSWLGAGTSREDGPWAQRLNRLAVEAGDRFLVPQGLVRCQGPSATILKVLPSGSMVQTVHDWDRPADPWDFTAPPRPVPIRNVPLPALQTVCSGRDRILLRGRGYTATLVNTGFFTATGRTLSVICPCRGRGSIETSGLKETVRLHPGGAVVIPAGIGRYSIKSSTLVSYLLFELDPARP